MLKDLNISVIGAGAWGTAIANTMATCYSNKKQNVNVTLITKDCESAATIYYERENKRHLKGTKLKDNVTTSAYFNSLRQADFIFWVIPNAYTESYLEKARSYIPDHTPFIICTKGLHLNANNSPILLSDFFAGKIKNPISILSGPNFASEIASELPAVSVIASEQLGQAIEIAESLSSSTLKLYPSGDTIGIQIAGAVKNVIAIACGIVEARNLGKNASAAVIAKGLSEMTKLGITLGGQWETFVSYGGVGDLVLTCTSTKSRNTSLGKDLSLGKSLQEAIKTQTGFCEGIESAKAVYKMAKKYGLELPICENIYKLLNEHITIDDCIKNILSF